MAQEYMYVGRSMPRSDLIDKVTGKARYTEDIAVPDMLEGRILHSTRPHANLKSIDTSVAEQVPGVVAVITHKDLPPDRFSRSTMAEALPDWAFAFERQDQFILSEKARYIGDCIAAVAAETIEAAEQALALITVEYEDLPAVFDPLAALERDAPQIHPDVDGNVALDANYAYNKGDVEAAFRAAEATVEFSGSTSRQKHFHLETDAAIAWWSTDGRLHIISPSQGPHLARRHFAKRVFPNLSEGQIQWESPTIGGGFGARLALGVEPVAAALAKVVDRPVRVTMTREEDFRGYSSRTDQHQTIRMAADKDGTLTAIQHHVIGDSGAYMSHSGTTCLSNVKTQLGLFRCENVEGHVTVAYTNTPTTAGFRGYGNPEGAFVSQQAIDMCAEKVGISPIDIRLKNIRTEGEPSLLESVPLEHTRLRECIMTGAERFGWNDKWAGWGVKKMGRRRRGVGMAVVGHASGAGGHLLEHSSAIFKVMEDGSANLIVSPSEMGQGILGVLAQIGAEASGLEYDKIRTVTGDTDVTMFDIGSHASRSTLVIGNAVADAGQQIKTQIRKLAVDHFALQQRNVVVDEIDVRGGRAFLINDPEIWIDVAEISEKAIYDFEKRPASNSDGDGGPDGQIVATGSYLSSSHHPNHQAGFVEVEVDTMTGEVSVIKYLAVHDIGKAINPLLVEIQMQGSSMQAIGFALLEDYVIDIETGVTLSDSLFSYRLPRISDVPELEHHLIEEPIEAGPFGAKGVGEAGLAPPAPAIANAIYDAIGARIHSLPLSSDKILHALNTQRDPEQKTGTSYVSGQNI